MKTLDEARRAFMRAPKPATPEADADEREVDELMAELGLAAPPTDLPPREPAAEVVTMTPVPTKLATGIKPLINESSLAGEVVAVTGKLGVTRDRVEQLIVDCGGRFSPRLTSEVTMLVTGDTGRHGVTRKLEQARRFGADILSETQFIERIVA